MCRWKWRRGCVGALTKHFLNKKERKKEREEEKRPVNKQNQGV